MNTFTFIGKIHKPSNKSNIIKTTSTGKKYLRLLIQQNENNSAYVQLYCDNLINGCIPVFIAGETGRKLIKFEDRLNGNILQKISYASKYVIFGSNSDKREYIWKDDFIEAIYELIMSKPDNTIYEITGEFSISYVNGKLYNNFNIKTFKIDNSLRPELKLKLELFYNNESLDESDKRNKFLINAFLDQYNYSTRQREYFPIQVQFVTNRFDFKNPAEVDIIKHRKANLNPSKEEGYVKAIWEAQYVRGAQLILPPLETLPKDIQFEIQNAGRDIKEYMSNIVGEASEFICLTRPDNTLNKEGRVYIPLKCTENEFKSKINHYTIQNENTIDSIAKKDAIENPFN